MLFLKRENGKQTLIASPVDRVLMICTKNKLKYEIDFTKNILRDFGSPNYIMCYVVFLALFFIAH